HLLHGGGVIDHALKADAVAVERRAQIMRDIIGCLLEAGDQCIDTCKHGVDVTCKVIKFVFASGNRHFHIDIAADNLTAYLVHQFKLAPDNAGKHRTTDPGQNKGKQNTGRYHIEHDLARSVRSLETVADEEAVAAIEGLVACKHMHTVLFIFG